MLCCLGWMSWGSPRHKRLEDLPREKRLAQILETLWRGDAIQMEM